VSDAGPGELTVPEGCHSVEGRALGQDVAVVASRYNSDVVQRLLDGAVARLMERGIGVDHITVVLVPGAWELPLACRRLADAGSHQAVVALGCVIRGGTPHFEYVCNEASRGVIQAALDTGVPVSFGLLTCDTMEQALERSAARTATRAQTPPTRARDGGPPARFERRPALGHRWACS
jgi:6,7-dimethyl-8-ribityllumazine synthase